eukprot:GDKI01007118.1.p1 GENE.GDKI01007118.1~~GDKI01007118.1.p1  ORF type:complete len:548 (-),score=143.29 GDKI01007118.1:133-1776(-)
MEVEHSPSLRMDELFIDEHFDAIISRIIEQPEAFDTFLQGDMAHDISCLLPYLEKPCLIAEDCRLSAETEPPSADPFYDLTESKIQHQVNAAEGFMQKAQVFDAGRTLVSAFQMLEGWEREIDTAGDGGVERKQWLEGLKQGLKGTLVYNLCVKRMHELKAVVDQFSDKSGWTENKTNNKLLRVDYRQEENKTYTVRIRGLVSAPFEKLFYIISEPKLLPKWFPFITHARAFAPLPIRMPPANACPETQTQQQPNAPTGFRSNTGASSLQVPSASCQPSVLAAAVSGGAGVGVGGELPSGVSRLTNSRQPSIIDGAVVKNRYGVGEKGDTVAHYFFPMQNLMHITQGLPWPIADRDYVVDTTQGWDPTHRFGLVYQQTPTPIDACELLFADHSETAIRRKSTDFGDGIFTTPITPLTPERVKELREGSGRIVRAVMGLSGGLLIPVGKDQVYGEVSFNVDLKISLPSWLLLMLTREVGIRAFNALSKMAPFAENSDLHRGMMSKQEIFGLVKDMSHTSPELSETDALRLFSEGTGVDARADWTLLKY